MDYFNILYYIVAIPSIIIASTIHEFSHAVVATFFGDPTPKMTGRLTLNPLKHIDIIGSISLILFKFGWSKPVLVNPSYFKKPLFHNALVALAGPVSNMVCVAFTGLLIRLLAIVAMSSALYITIFEFVIALLTPFLIINASLAIFNLIPIPPLDGSRILILLIPKDLRGTWKELDRYGFLILLPFIISGSPLAPVFDFVITQGMSILIWLAVGYPL